MTLPELAYIDPGSGSLIIQGAIASIVAAVVFFRNQIARFLPGSANRSKSATERDTTTSVDDAAQGG